MTGWDKGKGQRKTAALPHAGMFSHLWGTLREIPRCVVHRVVWGEEAWVTGCEVLVRLLTYPQPPWNLWRAQPFFLYFSWKSGEIIQSLLWITKSLYQSCLHLHVTTHIYMHIYTHTYVCVMFNHQGRVLVSLLSTWYRLELSEWRATSADKMPPSYLLQGIFFISDWWGRAQDVMSGAVPGLAALGSIRKQAE